MIYSHDKLWNFEEAISTERVHYENLSAKYDYYAYQWTAWLNGGIHFEVMEHACPFTICNHIQYRQVLERVPQLRLMFSPHATSHFVGDTRIVPILHYPTNGIEPASKSILFSFVGATSTCSRVREPLGNLSGGIIRLRDSWNMGLDAETRQQNEQEFREILAASIFCLCPRGAGPGSIRIAEAIQAEAIPVILADDLLLPPAVELCSIRVRESQASQVDTIIKSIGKHTISRLQRAVRQAKRELLGDFSGSLEKQIETCSVT